MKKLLVTLAICLSIKSASSQTIGSHYNEVKENYPNGVFTMDDDKTGYHLFYQDKHTRYIYFMDLNLIVYGISIQPLTQGGRQAWIERANDQWVIISNTKWKLYKSDGDILVMRMEKVNDNIVFLIQEDK
jgi:hypothetical protein